MQGVKKNYYFVRNSHVTVQTISLAIRVKYKKYYIYIYIYKDSEKLLKFGKRSHAL